jgi:nucleotide-binding universal stress UspA family protein
MIRSLMVGLDGSAQSSSATRLGIEWARRTGALLAGLAVVDEPTIAASAPVMLGGPPYADPVLYRERMADARRQVGQFLDQFALRCAEAGVACKLLEGFGLPWEQIALEAQRFDLILMGQKTRFHFEIQDRHDDTLPKVVKNSPRPVVVVPEAWREGRSVVVAFDGSFPAARALFAFRASGLDQGRQVHVVSVRPERGEALRVAERAVEYLRSHEIRSAAYPVASTSDPAGLILAQLRDLEADLLVMGAYGQPTVRESFIGSATATMVKDCPVPLFLFH